MTTTIRLRRTVLAFGLCLATLPAVALDAIDEGDVTIGAGTLAIAPESCEPTGLGFDTTTVVSSGTLTVASIQQTFEDNAALLAAVYQHGLARQRCLAGDVRAHIVTAPTGLVSQVQLEFSNPGLAVLHPGLSEAIGHFHFELTGQPASFSYTLSFQPK